MAEALEDRRDYIFKYKLQVLDKLLDHLKRREISDLWENCFSIFSKYYESDTIFELLLKMDAFCYSLEEKYLEVQVTINGTKFTHRRLEPPYIAGGINQIFSLIEYFENELVNGTFSKTKNVLNTLPSDIQLKSYYQSVGKSWQKTLDLAFETYAKLSKEEEKHLKFYANRLEKA